MPCDSPFVLVVPRAGRAADTAEVKRALRILAEPRHGIQLQAAPGWGNDFGTFAGTDVEAMAAWVQARPNAEGVYFALNPVAATLSHAVKNGDPVCRRWLLIDVDRDKREGFGSSATEAEHDAALELAADIKDYLDGQGWPAPLAVDSGNGAHLLYRIDLPNDVEGKTTQRLVREFLKVLAVRFDRWPKAIGRECHDARRVSKLPGTWACKGEDTPERPYRLARILHAPDQIEAVHPDRIAAVLQLLTDSPPPPPGQTRNPFLLQAGQENSGYVRRALESECGRLALTPRGGINEQLFRSGAAMGNFVGAGLLPEEEVFAALLAAAQAAGADNPHKDEDTLRRAIDQGKTTPREAPKAGGDSAPAPEPPTKGARWRVTVDGVIVADDTPDALIAAVKDPTCSAPGRETFEIYTLAGLLAAELPEPRWVVPGILSEGLNILAGKPKQGKSMLSLNLAITIATGGMALGAMRTVPGDILYLSLEDKQRRVQGRAKKMVKDIGAGADRLSIVTTWPRQDKGGLQLLDVWFKRADNPTLVIIDVWSIFRPAYRTQGSQYEQDYQHMRAVKDFIDRRSCTALLLMHCRKGASDDVLEEVSGTMGLTGVADGIIVLNRIRNDNEAKIYVTGRDVQEQELAIRFDPATLTWTSLGPSEKHFTGKLQSSIVKYLQGLNGRAAFATDIAGAIGEPSSDKIRPVLHRLFERKIIRHVGNAWAYPGDIEAVQTNGLAHEDEDEI
jgi:hypothetical protein